MLNFDEDAKRIGRNITNLLIEHNKSQQDLANALNVSKSTVSTWTNGKRIPRMDKVNMMCSFFGVERSAILGEGGNSIKNKMVLTEEMLNAVVDVVKKEMISQGMSTRKDTRQLIDALDKNPSDLQLCEDIIKLDDEKKEMVARLTRYLNGE